MKYGVVFVLAAGCANAYQSARPLPRGKTQITVGVSRADAVGPELTREFGRETWWLGDVHVRTGFGRSVDVGMRITRTAGRGDSSAGNRSLLGIDLKWSPSDEAAKTTIAFGLPIGTVWLEGTSVTDSDRLAYVVSPTVFVGLQLSSTTEIVIAPKLFVISPDIEGRNTEIELGASFGIRLTDAARTWAVHPEIGFLRVSSLPVGLSGESDSLVMLGLGIAVGN